MHAPGRVSSPNARPRRWYLARGIRRPGAVHPLSGLNPEYFMQLDKVDRLSSGGGRRRRHLVPDLVVSEPRCRLPVRRRCERWMMAPQLGLP